MHHNSWTLDIRRRQGKNRMEKEKHQRHYREVSSLSAPSFGSFFFFLSLSLSSSSSLFVLIFGSFFPFDFLSFFLLERP